MTAEVSYVVFRGWEGPRLFRTAKLPIRPSPTAPGEVVFVAKSTVRLTDVVIVGLYGQEAYVDRFVTPQVVRQGETLRMTVNDHLLQKFNGFVVFPYA